MKNTLALALIGGLLAMANTQTQAQSALTNLQQTITLSLTGNSGGASNGTAVANVRIGTKDVLNAVGGALGKSFSSKAKLIALSSVGPNTSLGPFFVVSDVVGGTNLYTDVSEFFSTSGIGIPVVKVKANPNGTVSGTEWGINEYALVVTNGPAATMLSFDLQGFTTTTLSSGVFNATVNGPGTVNNQTAALKGTINGSALKASAIALPSVR